MSDSGIVSGVLNALLCGVTGYGFYAIAPQEHPYAFSACVIGFCHGLLGLVECLTGDENVKSAKETTTAIVEIIPLPLVNIDLFFGGDSNNIALGHGLFIVPMAISLIVAFCKGGEGESDDAYETLKMMTILGNITSLCFLAVNDGSMVKGTMAFLAFMAKYGAEFCESMVESTGEPIKLLSWSGFFFLTTMAIAGGEN
ncbi:hypothetical protein KR222_004549 [Zaprionus bogoriensis]|nr:hypothetical protein KR222_004549 [Zaprionus bogoriensis]